MGKVEGNEGQIILLLPFRVFKVIFTLRNTDSVDSNFQHCQWLIQWTSILHDAFEEMQQMLKLSHLDLSLAC